jgi:hypothetical protein
MQQAQAKPTGRMPGAVANPPSLTTGCVRYSAWPA